MLRHLINKNWWKKINISSITCLFIDTARSRCRILRERYVSSTYYIRHPKKKKKKKSSRRTYRLTRRYTCYDAVTTNCRIGRLTALSNARTLFFEPLLFCSGWKVITCFNCIFHAQKYGFLPDLIYEFWFHHFLQNI